MMKSRALLQLHAGFFTTSDAESRFLFLAHGVSGSEEEGIMLGLYFLLDPVMKCVIDAKFQAFADSSLISIMDAICEMVLGKEYREVKNLSLDNVAGYLGEKEGFPLEIYERLKVIEEVLEKTKRSCEMCPSWKDDHTSKEKILDWEKKSLEEQMEIVEHVLQEEVIPLIERDGGGVQVVNIVDGKEVYISYQGECATCFHSTGATLMFIQKTLRDRISPDIFVRPI
jgi:NifU-like protein